MGSYYRYRRGSTRTTSTVHARTTSTQPRPTTSLPTPTTLANDQTSVPACTAADLSATATTDRTSYSAGTTVNVVVIVTNRSARACAFRNNFDDVSITDHTGQVVYPTADFGDRLETPAIEVIDVRVGDEDGIDPAGGTRAPGQQRVEDDAGLAEVGDRGRVT